MYKRIRKLAKKINNIKIISSLLKTIDKWFRTKFSKEFVEINGHRIYLDKDDSLRLSFIKEYEPYERRLVQAYIKPGNIAMDIGAHIGYFTLLMARAVGPRGRVYAFEPHPENFRILKKNIEYNGYKNVILINKAVSDKKAKEKLYLAKYSNSSHGFYNLDNTKKFIEVETTRLDDYESKVDFIKIDAEGNEIKILAGMKKIIENSPDLEMIVEYLPELINKSGLSTERFIKALEEKFDIRKIEGETNLFCESKNK